ncbi:ATPase WRNIP1 [Trichoplax sp. H2]|nr:ATPase WRNIP1 [Trichoplax sp. H2]|eukprot:RDD47588.1 ATPase WRNIP1 [Trichoplax sp. H2]
MQSSSKTGESSPCKCIFCDKYFDRDTIDQHANWCFESQKLNNLPPSTPDNVNNSINSNTSFSSLTDSFPASQSARSSQSTLKSKTIKKRNINMSSIGSSVKKTKHSHHEVLTNNATRQTKLSFFQQDPNEFAYTGSSQSTANNVKKEMQKWQLESSQELADDVFITNSKLNNRNQPPPNASKSKAKSSTPLADKIRPNVLTDYIGQDDVLGGKTSLRSLIESGDIHSMIFWGPPGCGKTTLANIIAKSGKSKANMRFIQLSATSSGTQKVREVIDIAQKDRTMFNRQTILFMDEIHRFNKAQQDVFLPYVENGTIVLIGATTENPSFSLNNALLSRCHVITLQKLSSANVVTILKSALNNIEDYLDLDDFTTGNKYKIKADDQALKALGNFCDGDARKALNGLEMAIRSKIIIYNNRDITQPSQVDEVMPIKVDETKKDDHQSNGEEIKSSSLVKELNTRLSSIQEGLELILKNSKSDSCVTDEGTKDSGIDTGDEGKILDDHGEKSDSCRNVVDDERLPTIIAVTEKDVLESLQRSHLQYDRSGEEHYNIISALHKSMRGGDENAAMYWLCRMLKGGEQPTYIARRLIRFASEDVGLADNQALFIAVAAYHACQFIGMPECEVNLAQTVVYLARAPKSVECYMAYDRVKKNINEWKGPLPSVPLHLRNAPTSLMQKLGYGKGYKYNPDYDKPVQQDYLPSCLLNIDFFKERKFDN